MWYVMWQSRDYAYLTTVPQVTSPLPRFPTASLMSAAYHMTVTWPATSVTRPTHLAQLALISASSSLPPYSSMLLRLRKVCSFPPSSWGLKWMLAAGTNPASIKVGTELFNISFGGVVSTQDVTWLSCDRHFAPCVLTQVKLLFRIFHVVPYKQNQRLHWKEIRTLMSWYYWKVSYETPCCWRNPEGSSDQEILL